MKLVTCFIAALSSGGAEHQLSMLAGFLAEYGYNVHFVTYSDAPDHYKLGDGVVRVRLAPGKSTACKLLAIFRYFIQCRDSCVISFGQRDNMLSLMPLLLRPQKSIKHISGERNCTLVPDKIEKMLFGFLYRRTAYVVANSCTQMRYIKEKCPAYADKTLAIPNYTDTGLYSYSFHKCNRVLNIVIFSRYVPQKNGMRFLDVVHKLAGNYPGCFHIDWYGNISTFEKVNEYGKMVEKIKVLGLQDYISLNDHVTDVQAKFAQYDLFAQPSLTEGFSNSLSEAICCGLPAVVSSVGDNEVMVNDGVNGFLMNPEDVDSMYEAFARFFDMDEACRREMSRKSREIAEALFDKKRFVDSYVKLIED